MKYWKVGGYLPMTNEQLVSLIQSGINVTENMGVLYSQNYSWILTIAKPYSKHIEIEDLMQEAYFGLCNAVEKYDPSKDNIFLTYATFWINQAIQRYFQDNALTKRIPSYMWVKIGQYKRFNERYKQEYGVLPSDFAIMEALHISEDQLKHLRTTNTNLTCASLDSPIGDEDSDSLHEVLPDTVDMEGTFLEQDELSWGSRVLWQAVNELDSRKAHVIVELYRNKKELNDIASEMGVSVARVGQIRDIALRILRKREDVIQVAKAFDYDCTAAYHGNTRNYMNYGGSITEYLALKHIEQEEKTADKDACDLMKELMELI